MPVGNRRRMIAMLSAAITSMSVGGARAAAPCAEAARHPLLSPHFRALERPQTWREALEAATPGADPAENEGVEVAACRHYLAGAAAFFLSERAPEFAPRAVEHLLSAQFLAPRAMEHVQARSRLRMAWMRTGELPGIRPQGAPATIEFTATGAPRPFTLRPAEADAPAWRLPSPQPLEGPTAPSGRLSLPPGRYRATVNGRCGGSDIDFTVVAGLGHVTLPPPPPCVAHLMVVDADGRALDGARIVGPDGSAVDVTRVPVGAGEAEASAPGYRSRRVPLADVTGRAVVTLDRCPVDVHVDVVPADARVEGAGKGPWGRRAIVARRPGYLDHTASIDVAAPPNCESPAPKTLEIRLRRPIRVAARYDDGLNASPVLFVNGLLTPVAQLALEPGAHPYEARVSDAPAVTGRLIVEPCEAGTCPPEALDLMFSPVREAPTRLGPWLVLGAGALALGGGLVAGASALATQEDIDGYTTRRTEPESIETLVARRDERARSADTLLTAGVTLAAAGLLWYWLGGD